MEDSQRSNDFESVKNRLAEIADAVDDENLSLDDALDLYEEAVTLGLQASDLLEVGIEVPDDPDQAADSTEASDSHDASGVAAGEGSDALDSPDASASSGEPEK